MKSTSLFLSVVLTFLFISLGTSCSSDNHETVKFDKASFDKEKANWDDLDIQTYTFGYDYFSSATGPISFTVVVRNGILESAKCDREGYWNEPPFKTISDIYDYIDSASQGNKESRANITVVGLEIDMEYDSRYHYPSKISYSTIYNEPVDGGAYFDFEITKFEVLK